MILHLVKCEVCENQYQFNPLQKPAEGHVSETWFTLFKSKDMEGQAGWDFCSKACLNQWSARNTSLRHGGDWDQLSEKEKTRVDNLRRHIADILIAETEAFYKVDPGLQLTWDFTLDALVRKNQKV